MQFAGLAFCSTSGALRAMSLALTFFLRRDSSSYSLFVLFDH